MKRILTMMMLLLWSFVSIASDTTIVFQDINHSEVFELAKKEKKVVMLYFHFDGCGACVQMERTAFKDSEVIDVYNSSFVNFEINTRKGEGIEINKTYKIRLHPTFLFLDSEGNELHRIAGMFTPEEFYRQGNNVLHSTKTLTNYRKQYQTGNREPNFLFDYAYMLRDAHQLDSTVVNEYLVAIDPKDYSLEKNIKFIYEFCVYNFEIFTPFKDPRFNFLRSNKNLFSEYFDRDQVETRIVWILVSAVYNAIDQKDEKSFYEVIELLKEYEGERDYIFKEMDGRPTGIISGKNLVLSSKLYLYENIGDQTKYSETLSQYIAIIWDDARELNSHAWSVFEQAKEDESEKIKTAIKCSIRSIELNNSYANNDTYAWLLYKSGEEEKALKQAKLTIEIAKSNGQDYSETQKLIDELEK